MTFDKDVFAGSFFAAIGLASVIIASAYPFGTTLNMGPGYLPMIVGGLIFVFGGVTAIKSLRSCEVNPVDRLHLRPLLLVLAAIVSFALLIDRAGMVVAVAALVTLGWWANPSRKLRQLPYLLAICLAVPILIFRFGLNMPIKLWML